MTHNRRLREAVEKFSRALPKDVDSVSVGITYNDNYLREVATGKQIHWGTDYEMLQMTSADREECKLSYDGNVLRNHKGELASTIGKESKGHSNMQAFILDKDGSIYIGTHKGAPIVSERNLTHASFLDAKPVEMAGMITIEKGKIMHLNNISGHYSPESLDMYRGIKKLQNSMPEAFAHNATIYIYDEFTYNLSYFISVMEDIDPHTQKPLHQNLRDERIRARSQETHKLKSARSFVIDTDFDDLPKAISELKPEEIEKLKDCLSSDFGGVVIKGERLNTKQILEYVIERDDADAMKVLLDSGIHQRSDYFDQLPDIICIGKKNTSKALIESMSKEEFDSTNRNIRGNYPQLPNILFVATVFDRSDIIVSIVEKFGYDLLSQRNNYNQTPLEMLKTYKANPNSHIKRYSTSERILEKLELEQSLEQVFQKKEPINSIRSIGIDAKDNRNSDIFKRLPRSKSR